MSDDVAYLLLGSNLGDRAAQLRAAQAQLTVIGELVAASAIYETAAWGREDQPPFLNQALALRTELTAAQVLTQCLRIEYQAGRERFEKWGSRTLDVDILLLGAQVVDVPGLIIPHCRLAERRFALVPLAEIAGELKHPLFQQSIADLLTHCIDPLPVRKWEGD